MKKYLFIIALFVGSFANAQELNCTIQILSPQIQNTNKQIFKTLETAILEFMNNTRWTTETYELEERIECTIVINITKQNAVDDFSGTLQIQSTRPVFGTSYKSPILNFQDNNFRIKYVEFQRLDFDQNTHISNLTSILAYYAYVVIGLDHDSFQMQSGTPYYNKAQQIVNNAQNDNNATGWKSFDGNKNRFWLVENLLNPAFVNLRKFMYTYHRTGMDLLATKEDVAKANIKKGIQELNEVHRRRPNSFLMQAFFDAKADEILNIFSGGINGKTAEMVETLLSIDASNSGKWNQIKPN